MSTMTTDQAEAVYAAEDLWKKRSWHASVRFGDWHEVQPFYVRLAAHFREQGEAVYPPTVMPRKGALKAHYDAAQKAVFIPPYDSGGSWALNVGTAIHEFAHHLTPGCGHGPEFRAAMVECLEVLGWADDLSACYEEVGLTTDSRTEGLTDKVRKLLTHADKAGTPEEQKTYMEKAESLAAENSINLALIRKRQADADDPDHVRDAPMTSELFSLTALPNTTYRNLAVELGCAIARAHGAKTSIRGKSEWLTFYGFKEDVSLTELMLTRITPMMFDAADQYLKSPEHKATGEATASARITFCKNFSYVVGQRLKEAVKQTEARVQETLAITDGSTSTALALRQKEIEVADYVAHEFKRQGVRGSWKGSNTSGWNGGAAIAGERSGRSANLFGRKELG